MKTLATAVALSLAADIACADPVTIYRYRDAGGGSYFSDKPVPGGKLIEIFRYEVPAARSPQPDTTKSDAAGEARIRKYLGELEAAWVEVQASEKALALAETRLAAGITPDEAEVLARGGPPAPVEPGPTPETPPVVPPIKPPPTTWRPGPAPVAPPAAPPAPPPATGPASPGAGGPMAPAPQASGGPAFAAPPSAGGPMATRRGGGMRPEYRMRLAALEADVAEARRRNQEAWRRYNLLR